MDEKTVKKFMTIYANFDLLHPNNQSQIDKYRNQIEQKLKRDQVAKRSKITTIEEFAEFLQAYPKRENKRQLQNKGYLQWALLRYAKGGIDSISDIEQFWKNVEIFDEKKNLLEPSERDINRYKDLHELNTLADKLLSSGKEDEPVVGSKKQIEVSNYYRKIKEKVDWKKTKLIYKDPAILVVSPKSFKDSSILSWGAAWCTGGGRGESNSMFNSYTSRGPLYIVIDRKKIEKRFLDDEEVYHWFPRRFNFHFEDGEFKNAANFDLDLDKIRKKYPSLKKAFKSEPEFNPDVPEAQAIKVLKRRPVSIKYIKDPTDNMVITAIKDDPELLVYVKKVSEELQLKIVKQNPNHVAYIQKPTPKVVKFVLSDKNKGDPRLAILIQNKFDPVINKLICQLAPNQQDICNLMLDIDDIDSFIQDEL